MLRSWFQQAWLGNIGSIGNCAWSASTAVQLALGTWERRVQASRAWKVGSWANQRARCFTWSQKLAWQRKLLRETDSMLSESQLAMLRKEPSVPISCNISSSPRLIDVTSMLLSLDVHIVQKVMWAGIHRDWRACRTPSKQPQESM